MLVGRFVRGLLAVGCFFALTAAPISAEIFSWVDAQGQVHFQDHPPQEAGKVVNLEVRESSPKPAREAVATLPAVIVDQGRAAAAGTHVAVPSTPPTSAQVDLYTVDWCPWCKKAREFFRALGVSLTEYDIEKDTAAAARKNALDPVRGVPFAVVNGISIHGYAPEAYTRALQAPAPVRP